MYEGLTFRGKAFRVNLSFVTGMFIGTLIAAYLLGRKAGSEAQ